MNLKIHFQSLSFTHTALVPRMIETDPTIEVGEIATLKIGVTEETIEEGAVKEIIGVVVETLKKEMIMIIKKKHAKLLKRLNKMKSNSKKFMKRKNNMSKLIIKMKVKISRGGSSLERMVLITDSLEMKINNLSKEMLIQIT